MGPGTDWLAGCCRQDRPFSAQCDYLIGIFSRVSQPRAWEERRQVEP